MLRLSFSPPTNTCTATASALMRTASCIAMAVYSSDSSLSTDGPPEARSTRPDWVAGEIEVRSDPRVHMSASASSASGAMFRSIRSRPDVGPWK
jgi:hypothetical protein